MNKLDIQNGGHRFLNDNVMFLQSGIADALKGLSSGLGGNFILSGCKLAIDGAGPGWKLTEGYVSLGGEIYRVEERLYPGALGSPVWVLDEDPDAIDPIVYADGISKNVHLIRKASVEHFIAQPFISTYGSTIINYGEDYIIHTLLNDWVGGALPVTDPAYIKEGRFVSMVGDITYGEDTSPGVNLPWAILPVGYRPIYNGFYWGVVGSTYVANALDGAGIVPEMAWIYIDTDGNCYSDPAHVTAGKSINLTGVRFRIA